MIGLVATAIALALYVAASAIHVLAVVRDEAPAAHARWFAAVGVAVHAMALGGAVAGGTVPGFAESLSAVALGIMVASVATARRRMDALGVYLVPSASVLLAASFVVPSTHVAALETAGTSWWLPVHLGLVFAATAGFVLEFGVGVVQVVVRRRLKRKQLDGLARFPSLDVLGQVQTRSLGFALACLGLGILAGVGWASSVMHHQAWIADPKVWLTIFVWVWYAGSLFVRRRLGWQGQRALILSGIGLGLLTFGFVGLEFLAGGFHAYGG